MSEQAPAGWYLDGRGNERYWDGADWTAHVRSPAPPAPAVSPAPSSVAVVVATTETTNEGAGMFAKLGAARKKAVADKAAAREEKSGAHSERALAAGALVTSRVFGTSTIEIYDSRYVRVAEANEGSLIVAEIEKFTPFEKLRSISPASPDAERASPAQPGSPLEGAVIQAMSGLVKDGKILTRGTAIGLATQGMAQFASNAARKSNPVIATDKSIHTLANQKSNGDFIVSYKEHDAVAIARVAAGNAVLGVNTGAEPEVAVEAVAVVAALPAAPGAID